MIILLTRFTKSQVQLLAALDCTVILPLPSHPSDIGLLPCSGCSMPLMPTAQKYSTLRYNWPHLQLWFEYLDNIYS